jgi:hypothetical protein
MKRIIKVLVVSALMVVLMATTVSPAFAGPSPNGNAWWKDKKTGTANETDGCNRDGNPGYHSGQGC